MVRYLAYSGHSNDYFNFRHHELQSLVRLTSSQSGWSCDHSQVFSLSQSWFPYYEIDLESELQARKIAEQSVLTKAFIEVWGEGSNHSEVLLEMSQRVSDSQKSLHLNASTSFCFEVVNFGRKCTPKEQKALMDGFSSLFKGDEVADMHSPGAILWIIELYPHSVDCPDTCSATEPCKYALRPKWILGRQVAPGNRLCKLSNPRLPLALSHRPVLGPTTLDNDLAYLMVNFAEVRYGDTVLDPFCGTCGILITSATKGARVLGSDLDIRVLRGWNCTYSKGGQARKDVLLNFEHYGLERPEILAIDNSAKKRCWRRPWIDKIVTDTPYGIRACTKKIVSVESERRSEKLEQNSDTDIDLLALAGEVLVPGGLLVFLMHVDLIDLLLPEELTELQTNPSTKVVIGQRPVDGKRALYAAETSRFAPLLNEERYRALVPDREGLRYVGASLQILSAGTGRLLVKMQKD